MIWPVLLLLGVGATGLVAFWDDLREGILTLARTWVRHTLGSWAEGLLTETVLRLDLLVTRTRRFVRRLVFARVRGRAQAAVSVEEVPLEDLPAEVRRELEDRPLEHVYLA